MEVKEVGNSSCEGFSTSARKPLAPKVTTRVRISSTGMSLYTVRFRLSMFAYHTLEWGLKVDKFSSLWRCFKC